MSSIRIVAAPGPESSPAITTNRERECLFVVLDLETNQTRREIELAVKNGLSIAASETEMEELAAAVWRKISKRKQVNKSFIHRAARWVRNPVQIGQRFQFNSDTESNSFRTAIPMQIGQ